MPVWVVRYAYPLPGGRGAWRYVVSTFRAGPRTVLVWGRRRFGIEVFFRVMKSELSLGRLGQRTALGVQRFLVLSLLAYLLVHWVRLERLGRDDPSSWRESGELAVFWLFPELVRVGDPEGSRPGWSFGAEGSGELVLGRGCVSMRVIREVQEMSITNFLMDA